MAEKPIKVTFKYWPRETGLSSVGHPYRGVDIKVKGRKVGWIQPRAWDHDGWRVWLQVVSPTPGGGVAKRWSKLLYQSEAEAKAAVPDIIAHLIESGGALHCVD